MDQGCCNDTNWTETCDPFKRICYQYGMLLGVDEFQQDQNYHRSKHRMNQRLFIGYGLVYGGDFSVVKRKKTDKDGKEREYLALIVHRLLGLDDLGRELWLKEPCEIDLSAWWATNRNTAALQVQDVDVCEPPPPKEQTVYVTIGYKNCCTTPVPAVAPPCDDQTSPTMASRILETTECLLSRTPPKYPPTDLTVARPADVRWADEALKNFAGWVQAMCEDGPRPLVLGTLEISDLNGTLHVKKCRNHALPRIAMKGPPVFQVVSVHPNLYCREPTLDVRFNMPPLVASIEGFHVLELRPPGHHHKGPHKGPPHKGGHHAQQSQVSCPADACEDEDEIIPRSLSGLRELVEHKGAVYLDEYDPLLLRVPLCEPPAPGNPFRIVIRGTGTSAVLTKGLVALNDGVDFTIVFENKEKPEMVGK